MSNLLLNPILAIVFVSLMACSAAPALMPTSAPTPLAPTPTPVRDTGWQELRPGMTHRQINLFDDTDQLVEQLDLVRFVPQNYRFEIAYDPQQPQSLQTWLSTTQALMVVNGGYFSLTEDKKYVINGLTVIQGQRFGSSYGDFGGMFAVTTDKTELRWLAEKPYDPTEPLQTALQSFPILVKPGGVLGFGADHEDGKKARRTFMAQDKAGRILFGVAARGYFTLHQLSRYLTDSDLELDLALNLDGGTSSGLLIATPPTGINAYIPLPFVIAVYPQ